MPDLDLETAGGSTRVYNLLHDAKPVVLDLGAGRVDIAPWADRVRLVEARQHDRVWELPVIGEVEAPRAVLIRPDGHVAWAGDPADPELPSALEHWFGPPAPAR
jgi:hypothetical protein